MLEEQRVGKNLCKDHFLNLIQLTAKPMLQNPRALFQNKSPSDTVIPFELWFVLFLVSIYL